MSLKASLTMYAWPEVQDSLDQFWRLFQEQLLSEGYELPKRLDHDASESLWHDKQLGLSQTCGYPLNHILGDSVSLLGTPSYTCDYVTDGLYASVVLARSSDSRERLVEFEGATVAINALISQSGYNALRNLLIEHNCIGANKSAFFSNGLLSGGHRHSLQAVAAGDADICAVDPVSFAFAKQYDAATDNLKIIDCTASTPGLPLICSPSIFNASEHQHAYQQAIHKAWALAAADPISSPLLLGDMVTIPRSAYSAVARHDLSLFGEAI